MRRRRTGPFCVCREARIMARAPVVRGFAYLAIFGLPVLVGVLIARTAVNVPYMDEWEWAAIVYKMHLGTLAFADLWAPHNEHRMLVPAAIMLGLARMGGWNPLREQFVSLGILVLSECALLALLRRSAHATAGALTAGTAMMFLYGLWQSENFGWGFQLAWFICNACAIAVALLLTLPKRRGLHLALAVIAAVVASCSSSQGLVVWAVGVAAILLAFRQPVRALAVWLAAGLVTAAFYLHGLHADGGGHLDVFAHPVTALRFALTYLGAPLTRWLGSPSSSVAGLLVLAAIAVSFASDLRSPYRARRLVRNAALYALAVYPLVCAFATAFGRAGFGVDQALQSRYTTIGSIAWIAAGGLVASRAARSRPAPAGRRRLGAALAGSIVFAYAVIANNLHGWVEWKKAAANAATARTELLRNDPAGLARIYPFRARGLMLAAEMRAVHDGPFVGQ